MGRRDMIKRDRLPYVQIENIILEKNFTPLEIAVYLALCIRSNTDDEAWPSYATIAKDTGMTRRHAINVVNSLIKKGAVQKVYRNKTSNLYVVKLLGGEPASLGSEPGSPGVVSHVHPNNNHINNNNEQYSSASEYDGILPDLKSSVIYKTVVDYLNKQARTAFKATTVVTQKLIRARANEGFGIDDFKRVIDNKVDEWKGDKRFEKYLRPITLFGNKFESYLQQEQSDYKASWEE